MQFISSRTLSTASFRFALLYAGLFSLSVLLLGVVLLYGLRASLEAQLRAHVEAETAQLLGDWRDDGLDELRHDIRERIDHHPASRLLYAVRGPDGRSIFDRLPEPPQPSGWHYLRGGAGTAGQELLLLASPLDGGYGLRVAAVLDDVRGFERTLRQRLLSLLLATLACGALGGLWLSRRFLGRVDRLARSAERIGAGWLSERLALNGSGDEFDQLAATINRMLQRIETLVGEVQQVSTSIAHDLRTPLGRLRLQLETLLDADAGAPQQARVEAALALLDQALATFGALLRIAEIESGARRGGFAEVDLSSLLARLVALYQPLAEDQQQQLHADLAPGVQLHGDAALLAQLCTNLLENALRHAGAGTRIELRLARTGPRQVRLAVRDDGPGIPAAERERMVQPFARLDRSRSTPGSGLGLSLAAAIARLHGAELELADARPGLEAAVVLQLP